MPDPSDEQVGADYFDSQMQKLTEAVAAMGTALAALPASIAEALKGSAPHDGPAPSQPSRAADGREAGREEQDSPPPDEPPPPRERDPLPAHPWWRKLGS